MPIPGGVLKTEHTTDEDLGTRNLAGSDTVGLRETTFIAPGVEGQRSSAHRDARNLALTRTRDQSAFDSVGADCGK